jgi:hypothetical protein
MRILAELEEDAADLKKQNIRRSIDSFGSMDEVGSKNVRKDRRSILLSSGKRKYSRPRTRNDLFHDREEKCLEPFVYLNQIPGKDVRGGLLDCLQSWLHVPEDKLFVIKDVIASLHTASLLIDDIEDNSKMRRGQPVAHSIYGIAQTINCANYVYFLR